MARRRKGEGTQYKTTINKKMYFAVEKTIDGKKHTAYSRKSYKEAADKLKAKLQNTSNESKLTVEYLFKEWLAFKLNKVKTRTYENYAMYVKNRIVPSLGEILLTKLTTHDLEEFYDDLVNDNVNPMTVQGLHGYIYNAIEYGIKREWLTNNVAQRCELPKGKPPNIYVLSEDEIKTLLESAQGTRMYLPILLTLASGVRKGELLGLMGKDVGSNSITISRSLGPIRRNGDVKSRLELGSTKNEAIRTIPLPTEIIEQLPKVDKNEMLFPSANGHLWFPSSFSVEFKAIKLKANLGDVRFHDLRHTHASHMLANGVDIVTVAQRLGHKNIRTTLNTYAHVIQKAQLEAANKIATFLPYTLNKP